MGLFSKMFGGNKSEKDVRAILPQVTKINQHFSSYESLSNDELRNKTQEFRQRIAQALVNIDAERVMNFPLQILWGRMPFINR
jgi:preprotein translocase subunit SecA